MKLTRVLPLLILLCGVGRPVVAQNATLISGSSLDQLELRVISVANGSTVTSMPGLSLLPIRLAGFVAQDAWRGKRPRILEPFHGITVLALRGPTRPRILHYRRNGDFGFVRTDTSGSLQVLIERPGLGPLQNVDPFDPAVGASRDGKRIAVSVRKQGALGQPEGSVWLIKVTGDPIVLGETLFLLDKSTQLDVAGESLTFIEEDLFAVSDARLLRSDIDAVTPFVEIPLPPSAGSIPTFAVPHIVVSKEENRIAVIAGSSDVEKDIYLVNPSNGAVTNLTQSPSNVRAPFSTPDDEGAPYLSLSDDGSQIAWQARIGWENELFVTDLSQTSPTPMHITKEPDFDAYIDTVSGMVGPAAKIMFVAGSSYDGAFDVYTANFQDPEDQGPIVNLTATSGQATPPFTSDSPSKMTVTERLRIGDAFLVADDQTDFGTGHHVWWIDDLAHAQEIATGLTAPPLFAPRFHDGSFAAMGFEQGLITSLLLIKDQSEMAAPPVVALSLPSSISILTFGVNETGDAVALSVRFSGQLLTAFVPLDGAPPVIAAPSSAQDARSIAITANDHVLWIEVDATGSVSLHALDPASGATFKSVTAATAFWIN